ncbi:MAG: isochorismatase (2,3 dihydro-2,3 dihydroxybenzoate synthase)-like protein [Ramlibacter sp.]|jgi:nicotinamidase-related amidase|nr:isochorismatase (2,3 dihydro-2,3 dihydroxybenzoate synthase)-like protein [Ramlibacter sp.]MCE3270360.1 isochorismatase (2,3 dihydro-2,3 dihydroxybenzoate synthase)-like protein [Ramlibacter sp.]
MKPAKVPRSPRVLILVDFINPLNFPGAEKLAKPALAAARATARLRAALDRQKVAVVYANDNYGSWQSDFQALVAQCCEREDASGEIARLLAPRPTDITLLKPRHSAFYCTALELLLNDMGARELVLAGLSSDMCVQMTAADAFLRGYEGVWVPADCTAAETPQAKAASVRYMKDVLKCDVRSSRSVGVRVRATRPTKP